LSRTTTDAEDVLHEAHLRFAEQAANVQHPKRWLEQVVTRLCLDQLKSARARREEYVGPWRPEPLETHDAMLQGTPVDPESISLAFLTHGGGWSASDSSCHRRWQREPRFSPFRAGTTIARSSGMVWRLAAILGLWGLVSCGSDGSASVKPSEGAGGTQDGSGGDDAGAGGREDPAGGSAGAAGDRGEAAGEAGSGGEAGEPGIIEDVPAIPEVDEAALPEPIAEAGFIELEAVSYTAPFQSPKEGRSERTRLFYSFIPADEAAKSKPLFVFFNGGPGSTSMSLLSFGTARYTLDPDDLAAPLEPNASSFTRLGSLLYIDSRQAGFSYGLAEQPEVETERAREFSPDSFNTAVDAADFVRATIRVLEKLPAIRNNPVVIMAESYGGTRATAMLDLLLAPHLKGSFYSEPTLAAEIEAHYEGVFSGVAPERIGRAARARQFGWQVLIQPLLVGSLQYSQMAALKPAALERMADEQGVSIEQLQAERCSYDVARPSAWCDEIGEATQAAVTSEAGFEMLTGVAPLLVPGLRASERPGAFRVIDPAHAAADPSDWVLQLGTLPAWDRYFSLSVAEPTNSGFSSAFGSPYPVVPFLRAARNVNTLITNARRDNVILSDSIVPALNDAVRLFANEPWFTGAEYVDGGAGPSPRFRLSFRAYPGLGPAAERIVHMPQFEHSGHFVAAAEPAKLFAEVSNFLAETGL
jgi:hypothetical protein